MSEKKLEGYKLKKLKSQFVYLRDVLQEDQYIYELALEKFYNDFTEPLSDEKVQKVKKDQKEQQQQLILVLSNCVKLALVKTLQCL